MSYTKIITVGLKTKVWWNKDSEQWIIYHKASDTSGYGKTIKKAKMMFKTQIEELIKTK